MATIKRVTSDKKRPGYRYDSTEKLWTGYQIDVRVWESSGKSKRHRPVYPTRKAADDAIRKLKTVSKEKQLGIYQPENKPILLKDLIEKRLADQTERKKRELETGVLNRFPDICGPDKKVTEIRTFDLKEFVRQREKEATVRNTPVKNSTINRELTVIVSTLNDAPEYYAELEEWTPPRSSRPKLTDNRRTKTTSNDEKEALLKYFSADQKSDESDEDYIERIRAGHVLRFAWTTGSRKKEIAMWQLKTYHPKNDYLKIYRYKNKRRSTFKPIPESVKQLIEDRKPFIDKVVLDGTPTDSEYVFSSNGEFSYKLDEQIEAACKACDIPYGRYVTDGFTLHSAGHDFITGLIQSGIDLETVREPAAAGISKDEIVLIYTHATAESVERAIKAVDNRMLKKKDVNLPLLKIYENVQNGKLDFVEFEREISSFLSQNGHKIANEAVKSFVQKV